MISMFGFNTYLLVILSRDWLTGSKFEVKIWTLIGGSCLGLLQTKTMSTLTKKKSFVKYQWRKINKLCCDPRDIHPAFADGPPQHGMIVCYGKFQQIPFGACVEHLALRLCSWDFCHALETWQCWHALGLCALGSQHGPLATFVVVVKRCPK